MIKPKIRGTSPNALLKVVSRELLPLEMYVEIANQKFQEALEERGASGGSINT